MIPSSTAGAHTITDQCKQEQVACTHARASVDRKRQLPCSVWPFELVFGQ